MLADPQVTLLVAENDGALVGCSYTRRDPADDAGVSRAELGLFAVRPAMQGRGLGGRLLEAQAELLASAGVDVLVIQVLQGRPELQRWYQRHGFTPVGRAVPFAGNPDWLKVAGLGMDIMERPLRRRPGAEPTRDRERQCAVRAGARTHRAARRITAGAAPAGPAGLPDQPVFFRPAATPLMVVSSARCSWGESSSPRSVAARARCSIATCM